MSTGILIAFTLTLCIALAIHVSYLKAAKAAEDFVFEVAEVARTPTSSVKVDKPTLKFHKGNTPEWRVGFYIDDYLDGYVTVTLKGEALTITPSSAKFRSDP